MSAQSRTATNIQQDRDDDPTPVRELEALDAGIVADDADGPEREDVKETDQAEEEACVQPGFVAHADLQQRHVEGVEERGEQGEHVAQHWLMTAVIEGEGRRRNRV
jgi:hypothetical protein